ncbi:hypothetical protein SCG7109_BE_00020 [Chlamydiales bacterium SCGC AG-110-M15]|nr:hypothetical protein SCG7109_BE_00020 [Chlamydiales bacterium SCGC AG-110-M15]
MIFGCFSTKVVIFDPFAIKTVIFTMVFQKFLQGRC